MGQSVGVVKDRIGVTSGELGGSFGEDEISYKRRLESLYLRKEVNSSKIQFKSFSLAYVIWIHITIHLYTFHL